MKHNRLVYSVEEAARLLRISRSHAYSLTETGQLPYIKLGKCKRITVEGSACSNCDATVSESAKFCPECGEPIEDPSCPKCGAEPSEGAAFCDQCGTNLKAEA